MFTTRRSSTREDYQPIGYVDSDWLIWEHQLNDGDILGRFLGLIISLIHYLGSIGRHEQGIDKEALRRLGPRNGVGITYR